jgi:hypothetical protein
MKMILATDSISCVTTMLKVWLVYVSTKNIACEELERDYFCSSEKRMPLSDVDY